MKICHMTTVHSYKDVRIFHKECKSLKSAGYEVHLIAPDVDSEEENGIFLHDSNIKSYSKLIRILFAWKVVYQKAIDINADVYHFHDPELLLLGYLLRRRGKKVIYDVHEDVPKDILSKEYIPGAFRKALATIANFVEKKLAKRLSGVIAATPAILQNFKEIGCNAININNFPLEDEYQKGVRNPKNKYICYVGGINKYRGLNEMLAAIKKTNSTLLLAGKFSDASEEQRALGSPKVEYLGFLSREEIANVYSKSYAGLVILHPTDAFIESLPIKLFEYMSFGLPVIASDFPLWKEIVEGNQCGICVNPLDIAAITEAINWLLNNYDEAKRMGENGRKAIMEKYNWTIEEKKLIQFYGQLLDT